MANKIIQEIKLEKTIDELLEFSIANIDKPAGPTSFTVDIIIKQALDLKKSSHFGTLDPGVTGVLPVSLNRACRLMPYFINKKKTYIGIMRLHRDISEELLRREIKNFIGQITQLPPVKSRVKRQERQREVYSFEILEINGKDILFKSEVEAGTYIRKLVYDIGEKIGGANMLELRRIQAGIFEEKESHTIFEFLEAIEKCEKGDEKSLREMLIPAEIILEVLEVIQVKKEFIEKLYHGSPLFKTHTGKSIKKFNVDDKIAVFCKNKFIGVFSVVQDEQILAKPEFVLQPIVK